jgi:hypothetical protein
MRLPVSLLSVLRISGVKFRVNPYVNGLVCTELKNTHWKVVWFIRARTKMATQQC